jgi:catechol-2,3-dioxygenase
MQPVRARFIGVELYFDDLERAKNFYEETLGLAVSDEQTGHHAQLQGSVASSIAIIAAIYYGPRKLLETTSVWPHLYT